MIDITKTLMDEHQNILRVISVVETECEKIANGKAIDLDFFNGLSDFIKNYVDKFHHMKEEDILFKAMLENGENMHCNPVPVMLYEHENGRNWLALIEEAVTENNPQKLISGANGYCRLLREHIFKEDNVLYPMAEEAINDIEKEKILKLYSESETTVKSKYDINKLKMFAK